MKCPLRPAIIWGWSGFHTAGMEGNTDVRWATLFVGDSKRYMLGIKSLNYTLAFVNHFFKPTRLVGDARKEQCRVSSNLHP